MPHKRAENAFSTAIVVATIVLAALGFLGNVYSFPIGFGVTFLFGSVFVVIAVYNLGPVPGCIVAILSSSYTYQLWNHPYAVIIFVAESVWLGFALRRKRQNLVMVDTIFWLSMGLPLVWIFYFGVMKLGAQATTIIYLKQTINGIFNTLVASIMLHHLPLARIMPACREDSGRTSYSTIVFHLTTGFLMIPTLALLLVGNLRELRSLQALQGAIVARESREATRVLESWLRLHREAVRVVGAQSIAHGLKPGAEIKRELQRLTQSLPAFRDAYLLDDTGNVIDFHQTLGTLRGPDDGLDDSLRDHFKRKKVKEGSEVTDLLLDLVKDGERVFAIFAPIYVDGTVKGHCMGTIRLDSLKTVLKYSEHLQDDALTIYDGQNRMVCSTKLDGQPLLPSTLQTGQSRVLDNGVEIWAPQSKANVSFMDIWKEAVFLFRVPIGGTSWTLLGEASVAPLQRYLYHATIVALALVFGLFVVANGVALWISQWFAKSPAELAAVSRNLPETLSSKGQPLWPDSKISEMWDLTENFKAASKTIKDQFTQIQSANFMLEKRVAERTSELQSLAEELEDRVEREIKLRMQSEDMALQQSKLAAMGEMIGAIAHQWRQPLNALGLVVQNTMEDYDAGLLDRERMWASTRQAMDHIRLMSQTIDDFRTFFRPDKEESDFDVVMAIQRVISLFTAQLQALEIHCTLQAEGRDIALGRLWGEPNPRWMVSGFRNEFEHVILNVVSNAKDAIIEARNASGEDETTGRIEIEVDLEEHWLQIRFHDNGCGVSDQIRDKIFHPYASTKGKMHGMGMGLYMSKVIVEDHMCGRLILEKDTLSSGTTFTIQLPSTKGPGDVHD